MKNLKLAAVSASLFLAFSTAAISAPPSKAEYQAAKESISTKYKSDKAACQAMSGNTKDICVEEAKGKEKVAKADLEYTYTRKATDRTKAQVAKAEAAYAVAKERCDDLAGNPKDVCVKEAKAIEVGALADARMGKEIGQARRDAATDKLDADYKVAIEKCDALAGDVKASCVTAAKSSFGKT